MRISTIDWQLAVAVVEAISGEDQRVIAQARLLVHASPEQRASLLPEVLVSARALRERRSRLSACAAIAAVLEGSDHHDMFDTIRQLALPERESCEDPARLAAALDQDRSGDVAAYSLQLAAEINRRDDRAETYAIIAPLLPEAYQGIALWKAMRWLVTVKSGSERLDRKRIDVQAAQLADLPRSPLLQFWQTIVQDLASLDRPYALALVRSLAPTIARLIPEDDLREVFLAVQDIGRWWLSRPWFNDQRVRNAIDTLRQISWRQEVPGNKPDTR